jgi:hypothetical protein
MKDCLKSDGQQFIPYDIGYSVTKVYQLLAHGQWFSPASSTTKTGRHDIAEIFLQVVLNIKSNKIKHINGINHRRIPIPRDMY